VIFNFATPTNDIKDKKMLRDFSIQKEIKKARLRSFADTFILQPNIGGLGIDIKMLLEKTINN
jgi:hypothetical protein